MEYFDADLFVQIDAVGGDVEKSAEIGSRWYDGDMVVTQAYYIPGEQIG